MSDLAFTTRDPGSDPDDALLLRVEHIAAGPGLAVADLGTLTRPLSVASAHLGGGNALGTSAPLPVGEGKTQSNPQER
jgi:hypothetical protein